MDSSAIRSFLPEERIIIVQKGSPSFKDKYQFLEYLFDHCIKESAIGAKREYVWQSLLEREHSVSTGVGMGIAFPHCSSEYITGALGFMAVLKEGLDFDSVDNQPIQIAVLLLFPKDKFDRHISLLGSMARIFHNKSNRKKILEEKSIPRIQKIMEDALKTS